MSPIEQKLAALLLGMASKVYMRHGCSDFCLVKNGKLTPDEAKQIRTEICAHYGDELEEDVDPPDWLLMDYLANKLWEKK